jgi:hypothetical protein
MHDCAHGSSPWLWYSAHKEDLQLTKMDCGWLKCGLKIENVILIFTLKKIIDSYNVLAGVQALQKALKILKHFLLN